ncbi:hypothetical protein SeMB42_g02420 [Synchytrium endobioticum]|uniref:Secreted protein n=1 Tax=Synchytrium endobioticum TaxID=286115 RepID=A0A507DEI2_9FUNG|nr:hypothetical protein SeMB42_g02420 [Synchytrium endobioticum]
MMWSKVSYVAWYRLLFIVYILQETRELFCSCHPWGYWQSRESFSFCLHKSQCSVRFPNNGSTVLSRRSSAVVSHRTVKLTVFDPP